ncbi:MAG: tetratricopeptide repeat protein [Verrucomicrobiae bacterium]|nr:tetratricopeptide repeat protein [Verrucomicrobiae bacterium]
MSEIDKEVGASSDQVYRSKLLALAGRCLFRQGKFSEASAAFGKICDLVQSQPVEWLSPALAQVYSLLKAAQTDQAANLAVTVMQRAVSNQQQYQNYIAQVGANLAATGQITVPAQPTNPDVVASRLGKYFLTEGEFKTAKSLFQQALQINPDNYQCRLGLAEIALREDDAAEATSLAKDAVMIGRYQVKTLAAWPLLLAASRKTGTPIDAGLISGLNTATSSVRARATLMIVRGLRSQGDASWRQLAASWLQAEGATNSTVAVELKKLAFSSAHQGSDPGFTYQLQASKDLLDSPNISPLEWLSATKQTLRISLIKNQAVDPSALILEGVNRYGKPFEATFTQSLAMACKRGGRADIAQSYLQQNLAKATGDSWRRTLWSLAKLQSNQGDHVGASASYWTYAQNESQPHRFRAYALMRYALELFQAQQPQLIEQAAPQVQSALAQIQDYEVLLDVARQLRFSQFKQGKELAENAYQRGKQMALQAFDAAGHPSPAVTILFKFSRRAFDFHKNDDIIATWTQLDDAKRQWLWSTNSAYWNWQELVLRAYLASGQTEQADGFGGALMKDPATPAEALAILGPTYLDLKQQQGDFTTMFSVCERVTHAAPGNERTAIAYYWLALRAWKRGKKSQTNEFAQRMLAALGKDCSLYWKGSVQASAYCLKAGLDLTQIPAHCPVASKKLQERLLEIQNDLAGLPNSV